MRAPTRAELVLVALVVVGGWLALRGIRNADAQEAELRRLTTQRDSLTLVTAELSARADSVDAVAEAEIGRLSAEVVAAVQDAADAAQEGTVVHEATLALVPDSMPELRARIVERELLHVAEVTALGSVIARKDSIMTQMGEQLTAARALVAGLRAELVTASDQIEVLRELANPPLSNLEAGALAAGAYIVATDGLGGTVFEGLLAGGTTFVITKGGSLLWNWIF